MKRGAVIALLSLAFCGLYAQEADTLSASEVIAAKVFPVTKPSEEVSLESLAVAPQGVADVIRRYAGVEVKDYGGAGGLKTVNVRSLGSEHVGVFLDGVQVENAQNMQVDLGRFSTDGLSSVALYTGQKSRRLQTAKEYASGAAVYLESGMPVASSFRLRLRGGSFATVNPSLRLDRLRGKTALRVSAEGLYSSGRYKFNYFGKELFRENGDLRSMRVEAQLYGRFPRGQWRIHAYGFGSERGFPGPVLRRAQEFPLSAERQADIDLFLQGGWRQDWTERYSTAVRFKLADNYTHYATHPEKNPMALPYDLHYTQRSAYVSLAQSFIIAAPWSVDLSTDFQANALDSDAGQSMSPRRAVVTGALATRAVWEKLRAAASIVYLGARDWYDSPSEGAWTRENSWRDAWTPSLSVFWAPVPSLEVSAFAKRSWRLPSFNDLYYTLVGNSSLSPESATQTGLDLTISTTHGRPSLSLRLSPYFNRVSDKIVAIPTASQFRWTMLNIGRVDILGLDARASADTGLGECKLGAVVRYTFQRALDHSSSGSLTYGNQIPYIPRHSGSVDLEASWRRWRLSWNTSLTGQRWSRSANTPDYRIAPWWTSDLSVSRSFAFGLEAGVSCFNLLDRRYEIVQGYPMPGRSLMINLTLCL